MEQHNLTNQDIGLPFSDPRGEWYLMRDDPTAPGHQLGGARTGATVSERATLSASPGGSVSNKAGISAARAEWGTEDAPMSDTTSDIGQGLTSSAPEPDLGPAPNSGRSPIRDRPEPRPPRNRKPLIQVATLNVRGCGNPRRQDKNKLGELVRWMRSTKTGVVGLQETYLCAENFAEAERANAKVWAFPNEGTAHSAGTGFIVHRDGMPAGLTKGNLHHEILIPGRLNVLSWQWGNENFTVANVYAPNNHQPALAFFKEVTEKLKRRPIDVILGDWNHVEHAADRQPKGQKSPQDIRDALKDIRVKLNVEDSWRDENPISSDFTWESPSPNADGTTSRSRLDRILLSSEVAERATEHEIDVSLTLSDHYPVKVKILDAESPELGRPRWRMNLEDLEDEWAMEQCRLILLKCEQKSTRDPMTHWLAAKRSIKAMLQSRQAAKRKERGKTLRELKERRVALTRNPDLPRNPGLRHQESVIRERIAQIEKGKLDRATESSSARYAESGEQVNKYWFAIGKSMQESSIIRGLTTDDGTGVRDTPSMAKVAREHHKNLQAEPEMTPNRKEAIRRMELTARGKRLSPEDRTMMDAELSEQEARQAIKASQNGKAPGKDGLPYELYKHWIEKWDEKTSEGPRIPNIALILSRVWNSIGRNGDAPAEYVEGLMFLLFKKKRRDRIENYRPITLLGCDYKLQTKAYTSRLGRAVGNVLHPDQAGFVPGRDILDHVKLAKTVKEYCDVTERDGCLVALDQEKAYDRIDHAYLWKMLECFALPPSFIAKIKALYANAETRVLVNQMESQPFPVKRGVRQGDPLSCLLFNLAIEPLAELIRRSPIKGIKVPNAAERIVVRLFADDTQIYLSKNDKWTMVKQITDDWCLASTAKFNEGKTEFLPMGTSDYKKEVCRLKFLNPSRIRTAEALPRDARFVEDRQPLRILGGIVGNKVDESQIWEPVTSKIETLADKWSKRRMTLRGRVIVSSFIIQSRAQYLMMTNDPPPSVVDRITKATHRVMWAGKKRGLTTLDVVEMPKTSGGLDLPSFKLRTRAARLMTARKWCAPQDNRPLWADVVNELIRISSKRPDDPRKSSVLWQTWKETSGKTSKLPRDIQAMLKETRRYGLRVEALKLSTKTKDEAPIWLSKTVDIAPKEENSAAMKHLRRHHRVRNMGDLRGLSVNNARGCKTHARCMQAVDKLTVKTQPRFNIRFQTPLLQGATEPDNLDFTVRRKEKACRNKAAGMPTDLDPSFTYQGDLYGALRIFQDSKRKDLLPAYRTGEARNVTDVQTVVWTDGSTTDYGKSTQRVGFGVWSENPHLRMAARLTSEPVTNNRAELAAIVWALERTPKNVDLLVNTDSQYAVTGFTSTYQTWEDRGWLHIENTDLWRRGLYLVRSRTSLTTIAKVKAHSDIEGNEKADELAKAGAESVNDDFPSLEVPIEWTLNGARLQSLSFHDAYQWVRAERPEPKATRAPENLKRIKETLETEHGIRTTEARIWLDLRRPAIRREISDFLWTMVHGRSQCGNMFRNWGPEWEELQYCTCGAVETMEHLLTQCGDALWRIRLWNKASALMKGSKLIEESKCTPPSFEEIMGAASVRLRTPAATRLWSTIVTETAFTIWKLRNRSRFDKIAISSKMASDVWRMCLEKRAKTDLTITRLKGPSSTARDKKSREIATAWGSLLSLRNGVTVWNSADYG